jgi:uncharacterized protein (DUF4415 family)
MTTVDEPNFSEAQVGDKVRVKDGSHAGLRGVIAAKQGRKLRVELTSGEVVDFPPDHLTNLSLAARRAWSSMPKRAGRPKSQAPRKKMVSMRLDVDVWRDLSLAAEFGLIPSREEAVNRWLRDHLRFLLKGHHRAPPTRRVVTDNREK